MKIIDRYLGRSFLFGWIGVNLVLAGLLSFLELARQVDDIGKGRFHLTDAILYASLTLPGRMLELTPPSALLGAILALGLLARNNELLALRVNGIPMQRVGWAFAGPAVLTLLVLLLCAQFVIPPLEQTAWTRRQTALSKTGTILPRGGFWTVDERRFVNLRISRESGMQAVDVYEFAADGGLTSYLHAQDAQINMDGSWILYNIYQKLIAEGGTTSQHIPQLVLPKLLSREEASMLTLPPETLSLSELYRVIGSLQQRKQNIERYRLVLWQKLTLPLMTAALIILALPFGGRHVRSAGLGWQVTVGAVGGVVFFFLNRILGYTGLIYQLSPAWTTLMPALVLLAAGIYLLAKTN